MTCRRVRRLLLEYVFEDLERVERAAVESHIDGCPECRRQAQSWRRLQRLIPEPCPGALDLPESARDRIWAGVVEEISQQTEPSPQADSTFWSFARRWPAVAAAICLAFLAGRSWDDLSRTALRAAGLQPARGANYFSGLDSFERTSDSYLQRTRLLLMELRQGGGGTGPLGDPWMEQHSRGLLGEAPRHLAAARRLRNPRLEALLGDLEEVLREILDSEEGAALPADLESELEMLLFKLELLERPSPAQVPPPIRS